MTMIDLVGTILGGLDDLRVQAHRDLTRRDANAAIHRIDQARARLVELQRILHASPTQQELKDIA